MKEKIIKMLLIGAIIGGYRMVYAPEELSKDKEKGEIKWVEPTRGWDENGTYLWTAVSPLPNYNVGIGTSTPSYKLDVVGNVRFQGSVYINSWPIRVTSQPPEGYVLKWVSQQGAFIPQPDAGHNVYSIRLTQNFVTNAWNQWVDVPGMSITFTPKNNVVYIYVSATARNTDANGENAEFGQSGFDLRVINVNTGGEVISTATIVTDFDEDYYGGWWFVTSGSASINGAAVPVTPGQQVTFKLQLMPWASWSWGYIAINPSVPGDHCVFTIID